ncbi:MAG: aldehyde dehydrogenase family protein, partial [Micrococcales bacterium]
ARKPQGVIALIMPWNNPVALPVGNIAPALMSSNAVVFKPAPEAAAIGHLILESLNRASLPADLVRLVAGGASVGAALVRHPLVNAIAFTGSIQAGRSIAIAGAELFKPVRAELGGNNAAVVLADADLDVVVADLVRNVYAFAGQRCTAIRRLVVASEVRDEFVSRYIALAVQYETTKLISSDAEARVARQLELGIKQGAVVLLDGSAKLVEVVDQANVLVQQESFAPIAVLQVATNLQHAIELANGVEQGLVMSICTESDEIFEQVASQAKVGIIQRGGAVLGVSAEAPFSGWKASGVGSPEHGNWDFDFYTRAQVSYER